MLKDRVSVILNAIDLDKFQPDETAGACDSYRTAFRKSDLAIGIVGQLTPRKGQLELLRAFSQALKKAPNAVLLIVGAPLFNRDHEYLELLKRTSCGVGNQPTRYGCWERAAISARSCKALDLLVVNSSAEPFGLVILEAMACGTPVLAAAVDGIPEIIDTRENGWLVPARDERALAEAMVHLHQRPSFVSGWREQAKPDSGRSVFQSIVT